MNTWKRISLVTLNNQPRASFSATVYDDDGNRISHRHTVYTVTASSADRLSAAVHNVSLRNRKSRLMPHLGVGCIGWTLAIVPRRRVV